MPSPTFTLVQTYALPRITVVHADLFRVGRTSELTELGIDEAAADAVVLLEWPTAPPRRCCPTGSTSRSRSRRTLDRTSARRS